MSIDWITLSGIIPPITIDPLSKNLRSFCNSNVYINIYDY